MKLQDKVIIVNIIFKNVKLMKSVSPMMDDRN